MLHLSYTPPTSSSVPEMPAPVRKKWAEAGAEVHSLWLLRAQKPGLEAWLQLVAF